MNNMMQSLYKISDSFLNQRRFGSSMLLKVTLYSTRTESSSSATLLRRLQKCNGQRVSVIPVLDEWVAQGRELHHHELKTFITNFRNGRRFRPALEIAEWMSHNMKSFAVTSGHVAVQLDLISKVLGLEQAENYFNNLEPSLIDFRVYGALLNCYASSKSLKKAEATMDEIRKANSRNTLNYNTLLSLYSRMGMHEKLDLLMQEMEDNGIYPNSVTYNIRLNAYVANSDLEGMERFLMKMEVDPLVKVDFCSYVTAANGYIKAGNFGKASEFLKKAEHLITGHQRKKAHGILMTLYVAMQKKEDVYRLWNSLPKNRKSHNVYYVSMITSLEKLDDLDGATKILEEWEAKKANFDIQIPTLVISANCKKDRVREAEIILKRLMDTGKEPSAKTWSLMALGYYNNGQMEKAVEMTKKASSYPCWKPNLTVVAACLEYLKEKGDVDGLQEMLMLLQKYGSFPVSFKEKISKYVATERESP